MGLRVQSYAGYRNAERPRRFFLEGRAVEVGEVLDQWQEPGQRCFRVRGEDGGRYLLRYYTALDRWTLDE